MMMSRQNTEGFWLFHCYSVYLFFIYKSCVLYCIKPYMRLVLYNIHKDSILLNIKLRAKIEQRQFVYN